MTTGDEITHARPDAIDRAAELGEGAALYLLRGRRPEFLGGAERCRSSVLDPQDDLGLPPVLRRAVARRVAATGGVADLAAQYETDFEGAHALLASGGMPEDARLAAIARHSDRIALRPGDSVAEDLEDLAEAGLSTAQIVALSELLGFVCFQIRVVAGLRALADVSG